MSINYKDFSKFQPKAEPKPVEKRALTPEEKYERYKKMSEESIRTSNEKRKKIQRIEKQEAKVKRIAIHVAIGILVTGLLIAAVDKKPHQFGHNGEILDSEDSYSDVRGR